jgi:hypothetical protein
MFHLARYMEDLTRFKAWNKEDLTRSARAERGVQPEEMASGHRREDAHDIRIDLSATRPGRR